MVRQDLAAVAMFVAGLIIALLAAALLVLDIIESGPAAVIGIVGIGLIGGSAGLFAVAAGKRRDQP